MPDAPGLKRLQPFLAATFVLAVGTTATTVLSYVVHVDLRLWTPTILGTAPLVWLILYVWARRVVGRPARWLCLSLPFALHGYLLFGLLCGAVLVGCFGFGECP